jgi:hypothetical protein
MQTLELTIDNIPEEKLDFLRKEFVKLTAIQGQARGLGILPDHLYIKDKVGQEGLDLVDEVMKKIGYHLDLKTMKTHEWYPIGLDIGTILTAKVIFDWGEAELYEMGKSASRGSWIVSILMKFASLEKELSRSSFFWEKYYDFGSLETIEINKEKKYYVLRMKGLNFHPVLDPYLRGYFTGLSEMMFMRRRVYTDIRSCPKDEGDPTCREYVVNWH